MQPQAQAVEQMPVPHRGGSRGVSKAELNALAAGVAEAEVGPCFGRDRVRIAAHPFTTLQLARPEIRTALKDRRVDAPVLRLDPLPETSLAEVPSHLVFSTEPLLSTSNPIGVNFV